MMLTAAVTVCFVVNFATQCEALTRRVNVTCPTGQQARFSMGDFFRRRSVRTASDILELHKAVQDFKEHNLSPTGSFELNTHPNLTLDNSKINTGNTHIRNQGREKRPINGDSPQETGSQQTEQPWCCPTSPVWLDLGQNVYPRYVHEVTCTTTTCWYDHLSCQPKIVNVQVLMRHNEECYDVRLPPELRASYAISSVSTTVACECVG